MLVSVIVGDAEVDVDKLKDLISSYGLNIIRAEQLGAEVIVEVKENREDIPRIVNECLLEVLG